MKLHIEGIDYSNTLGPWLGKTFKMFENHIINLLAQSDVGISKQQWLVLNLINSQKGISQKDLAQFINRDKTSVTRFINTLLKKGFVEKKTSLTDKRKSELYLTKKGHQIMLKATPIIKNFALSFQEALTEEEVQQTIKVMQKIQNRLEEMKMLS